MLTPILSTASLLITSSVTRRAVFSGDSDADDEDGGTNGVGKEEAAHLAFSGNAAAQVPRAHREIIS